ncbi:MAG TPA: aldehyde dehydrogenase family protein [Propioniciclava sp.]|uniref:aldehyde dehydrogenase family protein n=1 Tax=Propioniciclava sp. TaxID=2038686 RepID=UPI002CC4D0AC|nr:aldehyde dehydrogenase family protein [Propioniciclava sp.]HRL49257.1 aldehyde dehydrogenase family protein [Propioniciclava sp.]
MDAAAERAHQAFLTWKGVGYADRADITPDNPAYRTEFFEPVAQIYRVKDEAEAITLANDPPTVWLVRSSRATSRAA